MLICLILILEIYKFFVENGFLNFSVLIIISNDGEGVGE